MINRDGKSERLPGKSERIYFLTVINMLRYNYNCTYILIQSYARFKFNSAAARYRLLLFTVYC